MSKIFNLEDYKNIMIKKYELDLIDASLVLSFDSKAEVDTFIGARTWV